MAERDDQTVSRMESMGTLAGGIAHDFNNLLAAVKLLAGLLKASDEDPVRIGYIDEIDRVTDSGAQLTRALLGFSGRAKHLVTRLSIHEIIETAIDLALRTPDPRVRIEKRLLASAGEIMGDYAEVEQVVSNLMLNARDAMTDGGRLLVSTRDAPGGGFVLLEVEDEGPGVDPAIRDRVFEPYFTTKSATEHTGRGLGLATVWGIVCRHGGVVEIDDAKPHGAILRVSLPRAPGRAEESLEHRGTMQRLAR